MIRLELHVDTTGDAFGLEDQDELQAQHELARILRETADKIERDGYELEGVRRLKDTNGNRVGFWVMTTAPVRHAAPSAGCGDPDCSCPECPTGRENEQNA